MGPSLRWLGGALALGLLWTGLLLPGGLAPAQAAVVPMGLGSEEGFLVFEPDTLTIAAGDRVRFEVRGLGPHNLIVAGHPEWSHEPLSFAVGESWEQPFDTPGRYAIWCEPHRAAGMTGAINVLEAGLEP
jgi:plastocyanin